MKKGKAVRNKNRNELKPEMKWQTGDFARQAEFRFSLPYQFLLLCKLADIPPVQVLDDFMNNLSCGSRQREGRDKLKELLIEYFIEHGYGQQHYTVQDIRCIFKEADAIGMLWPQAGSMKMMEKHVAWRTRYHKYWFKKWFAKLKRPLQ